MVYWLLTIILLTSDGNVATTTFKQRITDSPTICAHAAELFNHLDFAQENRLLAICVPFKSEK
jgi:hypothetical protein